MERIIQQRDKMISVYTSIGRRTFWLDDIQHIGVDSKTKIGAMLYVNGNLLSTKTPHLKFLIAIDSIIRSNQSGIFDITSSGTVIQFNEINPETGGLNDS